MAEYFQKLDEDISINIQEAQQTPRKKTQTDPHWGIL